MQPLIFNLALFAAPLFHILCYLCCQNCVVEISAALLTQEAAKHPHNELIVVLLNSVSICSCNVSVGSSFHVLSLMCAVIAVCL